MAQDAQRRFSDEKGIFTARQMESNRKDKNNCCSNLNAKSTLSDFYFLLVNKPDNIIAGRSKCGRFFQTKQELETDEDTDKEQGEHHKNCETSLDQGGVLSIVISRTYKACVIHLASYIVTLDAHVDS